MAAPIRHISVLLLNADKRQLSLLCNSCIRFMSAHPSDPKVTPPSFIKRYFVDKIVNGVSTRIEKLEKRYPKVFELYRTFRTGSSTFVSETRDYYTVSTALWGGRSMSSFSRHQLEVYKLIPQDLFKIAPLLLISVVPGGSALIALAYLYPKIFLSHHFWTKSQKSQFWTESLAGRQHHSAAVLNCLMRMCLYVEDQHMRDKIVRLVQKLEHAVQPNVNEILDLLPLFKSFPYILDRMPMSYARHLALCLNLWPVRSRLHLDGMVLLYTDLAMLQEGLHTMDQTALEKACYLRGLNPFGLTRDEQITYLRNWTTVSQEVDESSVSLLLHCPTFLASVHPNNLHLAGGKRSVWWRRKTGG